MVDGDVIVMDTLVAEGVVMTTYAYVKNGVMYETTLITTDDIAVVKAFSHKTGRQLDHWMVSAHGEWVNWLKSNITMDWRMYGAA